jgi:hypothetical protein
MALFVLVAPRILKNCPTFLPHFLQLLYLKNSNVFKSVTFAPSKSIFSAKKLGSWYRLSKDKVLTQDKAYANVKFPLLK